MRSFGRARLALRIGGALLLVAALSSAQSTDPEKLYMEALVRESSLRKEIGDHKAGQPPADLLKRVRVLVGSYQDMARLFPSSAYSDNALWQGGLLSATAFWKFADPTDRSTAVGLLNGLASRFPTSTLAKQVPTYLKKLEEPAAPAQAAATSPAPAPPPPARAPAPPATPPPAPKPAAVTPPVAAKAPARGTPGRGTTVALNGIRREVLPDALRFTIELEREVSFYDERLNGPPRVFIDLQNTRPIDDLKDATLRFSDDVVRQVRIGRQTDGRTRVVLDLTAPGRHSVYALYDPYRVVVDLQRPSSVAAPAPPPAVPAAPVAAPPPVVDPAPAALPDAKPAISEPAPAPGVPAATPAANVSGRFSMSRQLGLGVARIVIDPGHGGHDPGTRTRGLTEAELVLDVALRLEKLLKKEGMEVVLTRRDNSYLSLEERTALANQSGADLFLSIHANASTVLSANGVETYFLNFAQTKDAEAVAARENASSVRSMHQLPDIVRAITLSNKVNESRDFARMVQAALYDRLRKTNKDIKNLGVKQAPFVVLIGATMPGILSEIAFMSNRQEATLIKTQKYRQQIAEAMQAGIVKYQESLKKPAVVAATK